MVTIEAYVEGRLVGREEYAESPGERFYTPARRQVSVLQPGASVEIELHAWRYRETRADGVQVYDLEPRER